jgi:hypothetical protein
MAVRADDIALPRLDQHPIGVAMDHAGHRSDLGRWITVIERGGKLL